MSRAAFTLSALGLALAACTTEPSTTPSVIKGTAVDHGKALFSDHQTSPALTNAFSCATCHLPAPSSSDNRILTGAVLGGAADRPSFWGGQENDLLRSINDCRFYFMDAPKPWTAADEDAKAIYAYLASLSGDSAAVPFTVAGAVADLPPGDAQVGAGVFSRACQPCHGALHTGTGRLTDLAPPLPDDTLADHASFSAVDQRVIFVEKIRHGVFRGYGGLMPPFAKETLDDGQIAGLLSYFDLYKP